MVRAQLYIATAFFMHAVVDGGEGGGGSGSGGSGWRDGGVYDAGVAIVVIAVVACCFCCYCCCDCCCFKMTWFSNRGYALDSAVMAQT